MILEANGKTFEIKLKELEVRLTLDLPNKDASGTGSSTATLNGGVKAKKLTVNGTLPGEDSTHLTDLIRIAEAMDDAGNRQVYTISDKTADTVDIREVYFTERFDVRKRDNLNAWQINFSLLEYTSVAEKKEARQTENTQATATTDTAAGTPVESTNTAEQQDEEHGLLWNTMKYIDNALAPSE